MQPIHSQVNYTALYSSMVINHPATVQGTANTILLNKARYEAVVVGSSVPWQWVACVHNRESSLKFTRHLHNGDPLSARTVRVPAGRPNNGNPPFTWEQSAKDVLFTMRHLDRITDWSIEQALYQFEMYNGAGYIKRGINSPYLWSYTNHYTKGKYVKDGKFDSNAVDLQIGCAPLFKILTLHV